MNLQRANGTNRGIKSSPKNNNFKASREEIRSAIEFLKCDDGKITISGLKNRLQILFPGLTAKEYRALMNNKSELNVDDILRLVLPDKDLDNKFDENFDPILYAFQIFDSEGIGYISTERLTEVFSAFGIREISTSELSVLMRTIDLDNDGRISLNDFRAMLTIQRAEFKPVSRGSAVAFRPSSVVEVNTIVKR